MAFGVGRVRLRRARWSRLLADGKDEQPQRAERRRKERRSDNRRCKRTRQNKSGQNEQVILTETRPFVMCVCAQRSGGGTLYIGYMRGGRGETSRLGHKSTGL